MLDALLSLSLVDRFAIGVLLLATLVGFLLVLVFGAPVLVSWTWRWCQETFGPHEPTATERARLNALVRIGDRR